MTRREGHGWWPYLVPLFAFLLVLSAAGRLPEAARGWGLPVQVLLPAGLFLYYLRRGEYSELRGYPDRPWAVGADFGVGVLGGVLWMAPYVALAWAGPDALPGWPDWLRPSPEDAFDPGQLGASLTGLALALRCLGYGVVTPFVEEIFVRGFLSRYAEVFDSDRDFRDVPVGHYDARSLLIVVVFFTVSHVTWEWPVAVLWILGTQLWFYARRNLAALVVVHAGSNLSIFAAAWLLSGVIPARNGVPLDLWFFV
jgi:hypothetical protein